MRRKPLRQNLTATLARVRPLAGDGLFTAYHGEPNWQRAHDVLLPGFSYAGLRAYHGAMLDINCKLIDRWDASVGVGQVDVSDDLQKLAIDTVALAGFGSRFDSFEHDGLAPVPQSFTTAMGELISGTQTALFKKELASLYSFIDGLMAEHSSGDREFEDLLSLMLQRDPDGKPVLETDNVRNQILTFLIAGQLTTSELMPNTLYNIVSQPTVLHRVQAEVDSVFGADDDYLPGYDDIGKLTYLRQAIEETLRLSPPVLQFDRMALEDTVIGGKVSGQARRGGHGAHRRIAPPAAVGRQCGASIPTASLPNAQRTDRPHCSNLSEPVRDRASGGSSHCMRRPWRWPGWCIATVSSTPSTMCRSGRPRTAAGRLDSSSMSFGVRRRTVRSPHPVLKPAPSRTDPSRTHPSIRRLSWRHRVAILHGSNLGTCRALARQFADDATTLGCVATVGPLDDAVGGFPEAEAIVIIASSYNGQPTDDARAFLDWLLDADTTLNPTPNVAVLRWATTIGPTHIRRYHSVSMSALASWALTDWPHAPPRDTSGDIVGTIEEFASELRSSLAELYGDPDAVPLTDAAEPLYEMRQIVGPVTAAMDAWSAVIPMTIVENTQLVSPGLGQAKANVRVDLPDDVDYQTVTTSR